jgi:streptomycin 6-kinase
MTDRGIGDLLAGGGDLDGFRDLVKGPGPQGAICSLLDDPPSLADCRVTRVKLKPGRKLSAHYEVLVRDRDAGLVPRSVAVTWVPAEPEIPVEQARDARRAAEEARHRGLVRPFRELEARSEDGMRVLVSPLDERFPHLARLSDPRHLHDVLPLAGRRDWSVTTIRYRPGQRHVLRYDEDPGRPGKTPARLFAKLFRDGAGAAAAALVEDVANRLESSGAPLLAWRPLAYLPDNRVVVSRSLAGIPLSRHLQRSSPDLPLLLSRAGQGLRALQAVRTDGLGDLAGRGLAHEIAAAARAGEHVAALDTSLGARYRGVLERARELAERLPDEPPCFGHGDLKADHIWDGPQGLVAMDFDSACLADPALDCGKLLADIRWAYAQRGRPGAEAAQAWLLRGYLERDPHVHLTRCRVFEAVWLVKLAARRVSIVDPAWPDRVERLVAEGESVLDAARERLTRLRPLQPPRAA